MSFRPSHIPLRLAAGSFILNSGLSKWSGDAEMAASLHGFASGTYPALKKIEPPLFLKALAAGEIVLGSALLLPGVSSTKSGAGLVAFSGGLLGLYAKTPGMREGIRPTQQGTAIAKDIWLLGIGSSLVIDGSGDSHKVKRAERKTAKAQRKADRLEKKHDRAGGLVSASQKKALKKSGKKAKKKAAKALAKASVR